MWCHYNRLLIYRGHLQHDITQNNSYNDTTSTRLCIYERHPITHPHGQAFMGVFHEIFKEIWPWYIESTLYDAGFLLPEFCNWTFWPKVYQRHTKIVSIYRNIVLKFENVQDFQNFRTFRILIGLCPEIWINKNPWWCIIFFPRMNNIKSPATYWCLFI